MRRYNHWMPLLPNPGKQLEISVGAERWLRIPIRTHVITAQDRLTDLLGRYVRSLLAPGDFVFISERIVAITQGRAHPIVEIAPSGWAKFLVRFVHKSPYGIGLGSPWTMELAIREVGLPRILIAAAAAALTKPLGIRGVFYRVAGPQAAAIDGPCDYTLPPYNKYATLGPKDPDGAAQQLADSLGAPIVIIDANDLGVRVLGKSAGLNDAFARAVFRDNPLGQSDEQTPMAIVRKSKA